jgi:23S rRNA (adenine2503-C2)-methyltransferase
MGMGEPMLNLKNVEEAIEILIDKDKLAFSPRRITVSTVGHVPQLKDFLLEYGYRGKLAVSLHASNQKLREKLMPIVAKDNTLDELFYVLDKYVNKRNKRVTYEYILLKDVNDSEKDAEELSKLLRNRLCLVNLINFNSSPTLPYKGVTRERIQKFMDILENNGINVTLRYSLGQDIQAACGQLASGARPGHHLYSKKQEKR